MSCCLPDVAHMDGSANLEGKIKRRTLSETLANPETRHAQMQTE